MRALVNAILGKWKNRRRWRVPTPDLGHALLPWLALLLGLAATGGIWSLATQQLQESKADQFLLRAEQLRIMLEKRLQAYEHMALGATALFVASDQVGRQEWEQYVAGLRVQDYYPGLEALAFLQRVPEWRRSAHVLGLRAQGYEGYRIRPPGTRQEYFPLVYLSPLEHFRDALGYDGFTEPVRASAMELARDMGQPVMSGRLTLATREAGDAPGFVIYAPVYRGGAAPATVAARREHLQGFVASAFLMPVLMEQLLRDQQLVINFSIHDGISPQPAHLLYRYRPPGEGGESLQHTVTSTVAGRLWTLRFTPLPRFHEITASQTPTAVLIGGVLVSIMLFLLTRALLSSRRLLGFLRERGRELEREIGRRERVEASLQQAKDAAEAASRAKSNFLANVSHELRTPLNGILGYTQILDRDQSLAEHHREGLRIIRQSGDYLLTIVNDLLDISQVESTHLELYPGDIAFPGFLRRIVELFRLRAEEKGLGFEVHLGGELPAGVQADEKRLRQLLVNLLSNAVKFTERGGVRFLVDRADAACFASTSRGTLLAGQAAPLREEGAALIRFQVEDTGCGIPPTQFGQLARPFYQVGRVTQKAEGLGLGLALCRELVERMGGILRLSSEPGRGSVFWTVLPLAAGEALESTGDLDEPVSRPVRVEDELPAVRLAPQQAARLQDLALMGDVSGLLAYLDELDGQGRLGKFGPRLQRLAQNFQLEEIAELAQGAAVQALS